MIDEMLDVFIHEKAHVEDGATIGAGSKVWINAQIRNTAVIGEGCIIGKDTFIDADVHIGRGVKIQNGVSVYNGVEIEDDVFVGPNVAFTNDYYPRAFSTDWQISKTLIKKGVSIGANATIICGNTLNEYCLIGAGSVVNHNVPRHALFVGNPAKQVGYVCRCGIRTEIGQACGKCGFILNDE